MKTTTLTSEQICTILNIEYNCYSYLQPVTVEHGPLPTESNIIFFEVNFEDLEITKKSGVNKFVKQFNLECYSFEQTKEWYGFNYSAILFTNRENFINLYNEFCSLYSI
jgi:hypothetical protein